MSQRMIYRTEDTEQRLLESAANFFAERGFFDTQMKDIAIAVGVSRNTLYRYFKDKTDIGLAILQTTMARQSKRLADKLEIAMHLSGTGLERLANILNSIFISDNSNSDDRFIAEFDSYFAGDRLPADFQERLHSKISLNSLNQLTALIEQGQADGSIRADIPAPLLTTTLINALRALQQRVLLRGSALIEMGDHSVNELQRIQLTLLVQGLRS